MSRDVNILVEFDSRMRTSKYLHSVPNTGGSTMDNSQIAILTFTD